MSLKVFSHRLLEWYQQHKRDLPWRNTENPYFIWLSEIILQQTRVAQGMPYFEKFVENYPSIKELATAPEEEVIRLWQGLGYYSRARNLHSCAKEIYFDRKGKFPDSYKELLRLKGVGSYTAAAIASFAFGEATAVVDGNVFRVMARYFGIEEDIATGKGKKVFEALANKIIPKNNPGEYNQAVMEFGALQCIPKNPDCSACPIQSGCFAYNRNVVEMLPVKSKKVKVKERYFSYAHISIGPMTLVKKRGEGDIWQGLFDFPLIEKKSYQEILETEMGDFLELQNFQTLSVVKFPHVFKHILTHQRIFATFVRFVIEEGERDKLEEWADANEFILVNEDRLDRLGKPRLLLRYLNEEK